MTDITPVCPITGASMHRDARPMTLTYRTESVTFDMPGWYCDKSDESIHTSEDMKVSDRMLNLLKARVEQLLDPKEIRRVRKKLHLTQSQAGELIGGGPRAFQKYEAGDLLPSRAITSALIPSKSGCLIAPKEQSDLGTLLRYLYRGGKTARAVLTAVNISNHSFYCFTTTNTFLSRYFG